MTAVHPFTVPADDSPEDLISPHDPKSARLRRTQFVDEQDISVTCSLPHLPSYSTEPYSCYATDDKSVDDLRFPDEVFAEVGALKNSFVHLLRFMMVFGSYFSQSDGSDEVQTEKSMSSERTERCSVHGEDIPEVGKLPVKSSKRKTILLKLHKFYTIVVSVIMWVNVVRFCMAFTRNDVFDAIIVLKLRNVAWTFQVAFSHTSMIVACQSDRLEKIFSEVRVTAEFSKLVRTRTISSIVASVLYGLTVGIFYLVMMNISNTSFTTFLNYMAPFYTYIPVEGVVASLFVRIFVVMLAVFIISGWILPLAMNHMLALLFWRQFKLLYDRFSAAIDSETGRFNGSVRLFRRRHQKLCKTVQHADYFMKMYFLSGFGCHMAIVILNLYALVTFPLTDLMLIADFVINLFSNLLGLIVVALDGILVNTGAHKILERIHCVDVSQLSTQENVELRMFHRRLSGNPIGLSLLGLFVISKKTLLTVLSLMITYFLLVIKLSKTLSETDNNDTVTCTLYNNGTKLSTT